jgi:hypothetical protein
MSRLLSMVFSLVSACLMAAPFHAFAQQDASPAPPANASPSAASNGNTTSLINEKFGGLTFAAGPTSSGGFGATLKGDDRLIWGPFDAAGADDTSDGMKLPVYPFLGYSTDDSWNSKAGSLNQASVELQPGLDGGIFYGAWNFTHAAEKGGAGPTCTTNPVTHVKTCSAPAPIAPQRIAGYGFYGDLKYRYGTFDENAKQSNVNQFLAGGGAYMVWQKGMDQPWIDIWPRLSFTYYAPISTNSPVTSADLPPGVKANYFQLGLKTGIFLGAKGAWVKDPDSYPFRLVASYEGSEPTTGADRSWESMWNIQLSTDILGTTFRPAVTFQSGRNGGLQYDRQVLFGIISNVLQSN